jgi:hypothetical protein
MIIGATVNALTFDSIFNCDYTLILPKDILSLHSLAVSYVFFICIEKSNVAISVQMKIINSSTDTILQQTYKEHLR